MKSALVIVDVQNDFIEGGSLAVSGGANVAASITEHLKEHKYDYVVASKDWHINPGTHWALLGEAPNYVDTWPEHCAAGSFGSEFHEWLDISHLHSVFYKGEYEAAYSAFEGNDILGQSLGDWLKEREVRQVYICGIALDYCVSATVRDSVEYGFSTTLLPRLTASVDTPNHDELWRQLQRDTKCSVSVR